MSINRRESEDVVGSKITFAVKFYKYWNPTTFRKVSKHLFVSVSLYMIHFSKGFLIRPLPRFYSNDHSQKVVECM